MTNKRQIHQLLIGVEKKKKKKEKILQILSKIWKNPGFFKIQFEKTQ